jgi:hypothetical protein
MPVFVTVGFAVQTYRIVQVNLQAQIARCEMQGILPGPDRERYSKLKKQMILTICLTTFAGLGVLMIAILAATQGLTMDESPFYGCA